VKESLKDEIIGSFGLGFEITIEQVLAIYPSLELLAIDLCKVVVDGKLIEKEKMFGVSPFFI